MLYTFLISLVHFVKLKYNMGWKCIKKENGFLTVQEPMESETEMSNMMGAFLLIII